MTAVALERFLAALYTDAALRARFYADRVGTARAAGLENDEIDAVSVLDALDLELAAASFARKRGASVRRRPWWRLRLG